MPPSAFYRAATFLLRLWRSQWLGTGHFSVDPKGPGNHNTIVIELADNPQ